MNPVSRTVSGHPPRSNEALPCGAPEMQSELSGMPSGLHAKLLREARERSPYYARHSTSGLPGHIVVIGPDNTVRWSGHRDSLPACYRLAQDPYNVLNRPESSG